MDCKHRRHGWREGVGGADFFGGVSILANLKQILAAGFVTGTG